MEYLRLADYELPGLLLSADGQNVDKSAHGSQRAER